ncbi:MAG: Sensory box histidine kinase/response regulator [Myxococcaceae bacterium]|nr:Sensory box histidine kinase/response regulator [Myxococcaceae bacterium]
MQTVEELAMVADELPVAIWMGRVPSGEVVYTNAAFREVLGIEPPEGAARGGFVEPYGVHTRSGAPYPEDRMPFEQCIAAKKTVVVDDLVIHRRDGRRVSLRVFAKPIFDANGEMTHVLEAFTDISREADAERARAEGERRLARSHRLEAIGQLVAGIAHDFNNLLTVTQLAVSALRFREQDATKLETIDQIDDVTDSAVDLIKNLIGFARRERQVAAPLSLEAALQPILDMARRTFDPAITLRAELGAGGAMVLADPSQLEQMIMNLVINARDAITGAGEVVVRTSTHDVRAGELTGVSPGRYLVLEVCDTGAGIDPAIRERIFEPYFTTKTQGPIKGTGLGLSTVHGIVDAHGGIIDVDDNPPRGSVMRVLLPCAPGGERSAEAARERSGAADVETDVETGAGAGRLVLVVDDEPLVRRSTTRSLERYGFRVIAAGDGPSALAMFTERHLEVAAVVLDMVMPGMRGRDVYLAMRAVRPDVPVLLVTGSALDDEAKSMLALGIGGFLAKPYDDVQLALGLESLGIAPSPA